MIRAIDSAGNYGATGRITVINSVPADVTGLKAIVLENVINITWNNIADGDLKYYVIKSGTDWELGEHLALVKGNSHTLNGYKKTSPTDNLDIMIKAVDMGNQESLTADKTSLNIISPSKPIVTYSFNGPDIVLEWYSVKNTFDIAYYKLEAAHNELLSIKSDSYTEKVSWKSNNYIVKAYDTSSNVSIASDIIVDVVLPTTIELTANTINNNIFLYWATEKGSLPIDRVEIRKGSVFSTAEVIGEKSSTFTNIIELIGGEYTYWIVPIDTAGNYGNELSTTITAESTSDYSLKNIWKSEFTGNRINLLVDVETFIYLYGPHTANETFKNHFINNNWNTPQDQIDAGYELYYQPAETYAEYEEVFDYGVLLTTTTTIEVVSDIISNNGLYAHTISVSPDGIDYTEYAEGNSKVLANNFRYIKVKITFNSINELGYIRINSLEVRLGSILKALSGKGTALSTDEAGTPVYIDSFTDIESVVITAESDTGVLAVYDFHDVPNPTTFYVYLFNIVDGSRVDGDFSWTIRGY